MKVFVIVMLSFSVIRSLAGFIKSVDEDNGANVVAGIIVLAAYILALIFACNL